jgi:hypothetical protein
VAELLGLLVNAPEVRVWKRCEELYGFVKMMGGWPDASKRARDNFIVCEGFRLAVTGAGRNIVSITPRFQDLSKGKLAYGVPGAWSRKQNIPSGYAQGMDRLAAMITRVDDRCIVASLLRSRKSGKILGRIERAQ